MSISSKSQHTKYIKINVSSLNTDSDVHDSFLCQEHEEEEEEYEEKLYGYNSTQIPDSFSAYLQRLKTEKQNRALDGTVGKTASMRVDKKSSTRESAVRRAFSMGASPSVYLRIDHQHEPVGDEEDLLPPPIKPIESSEKRNKILEACRSFFGF